MNFPCSMNSKQTVNALQVRFNGVPCNATGVSNLALKNITNGYVATVFETNGGVFTTDLIQLAKGENKFEIAYDLPSGEPKVGTFSITNVNGN